MTQLVIIYLPTHQLLPYARNARTHSPEQVRQIAASIREYGFTNPILIDEHDGIIAGHGRVMAALLLNMDEVPCIRLSHLSEAQRRAYILADNQLALNAGWDEDLLKAELLDLRDLQYDLDLIGFDDSFLDELLVKPFEPAVGNTDEDNVPPEPVDPVTQPGDLWQLGKHRVLCGDSTDPEAVRCLLNGAVPHLMVTDPPYGIEYAPDWRNNSFRKNGEKIGGRALGTVLNDDNADWSDAWALFPGEVAYVWHASIKSDIVKTSLEVNRFDVRCHIIWAKNNFAISRGHYHPKHEPCWYAVKRGGTGHWQGDRSQSTVWDIAKNLVSETGHSTQKPVECMRKPMINNSAEGDSVYDPFLGSGTSVIAAEQTGRICYGLELNPAYVDIIVKRWEDFTGQKAALVSDQLIES